MSLRVQAWSSNFDRLADQVRSMMDDMKSPGFFGSHTSETWRPRLNFCETAGEYVICLELSGMRCEDIEVTADNRMLRICGVRARATFPPDLQEDASESRVSVHLMEIDSGRFERKLPLPDDVHTDGISAAYRHGYLWITLPRDVNPGGLSNA